MFISNFKASRLILAALAALAMVLGLTQPASATPSNPVAGWRKSLETPGHSWANDIATDSTGNVFLASRFYGEYPGHVGPNANNNAMLTKFDSNGNEVWFKNFSTSNWGYIGSITVDAPGNIYVGGIFGTEITYEGTTYRSQNYCSQFIVKLAQSGALIWFKTLEDEDCDAPAVRLDSAGNVYFQKWFNNINASGAAGIDGVTWHSSYQGPTDAIAVIKLNANGIVQRVTPLPPSIWTLNYPSSGLEVSPSGKIILSGHIYSNLQFDGYGPYDCSAGGIPFWMELDSSGQVVAFNALQTASSDTYIEALAFDPAENVYISGSFYNTSAIGQFPITSQGNSDIFVAKYLANAAEPNWVRTFGGINLEDTAGLAVDSAGNIVFTSEMYSSVTFSDFPTSGQSTTVPVGQGGSSNLAIGLNNDGSTAWYSRIDAPNSAPTSTSTRPALFDGGMYFGGRDTPDTTTNIMHAFVQKLAFSFANTTPMASAGSENPPAQTVRPLPALQVGSISPSLLDSAAGGLVTVTSSNASKVTSVRLGNISLPFKILSADRFQVTLPAHEVGYADLTFTTSDGVVPLSNAVRYSDVLNTHLAVITLVNPTRALLASAKAKFVKITYTDRIVTKGKKPKVTITLTGRIKN
jgi:hypothetical protein